MGIYIIWGVAAAGLLTEQCLRLLSYLLLHLFGVQRGQVNLLQAASGNDYVGQVGFSCIGT
jgi:hypothetical protein